MYDTQTNDCVLSIISYLRDNKKFFQKLFESIDFLGFKIVVTYLNKIKIIISKKG